MKQKKNTLRPRNEYVALMRMRKAGAHQKSRKAERRAETVALKQMNRDVPGRATPSPSAPGRNADVAKRRAVRQGRMIP
jgi:hypothetical protein